MKKLLFGLIATVMFGFVGNAQTASRTKLFCIKESCCSAWIFGIEIWSQTTCHYVSAGKIISTMYFETHDKVEQVEVSEDILLAGEFSDTGEHLILPKGVYPVKDNQIEFNPLKGKSKTYCYIREVSGNLLGHDYQYNIKLCVTLGKNSNGVVSIKPQLNKDELERLLQSENKSFKINEDIILKEDGLNCIVKAGQYIMNEDGHAYLQNFSIK